MGKKVMLFGVLLLSLNAHAGAIDNLNSALMTTIKNQTITTNLQNPFAIVYGGKDFSHPQIAVAHESIWKGHSTFVG